MDFKLIAAIVTITMALIFYTIGVWTEHKQKCLKKFHLVFFWIGLLFDTTGTTIMSLISQENGGSSLLSRSIGNNSYACSRNMGNRCTY